MAISDKVKAKDRRPNRKADTLSPSVKFRRKLALICALTGFALYFNTIGFDYVLDDNGLIKYNSQTRQGVSAISDIFSSSYRSGSGIADYDLYRPLSKAMFAVEWSLSPDNPSLSHFINVLLFAFTCYVLFLVFSRYHHSSWVVPFLTTMLFAVHPIHTEVVANIKSRDEILCFLLCIGSLGAFHAYVSKDSPNGFLAGVLLFFLALFAKESAITFLAIVPLCYYFFTRADKRKYVRTIVAMLACTIVFLLIRKMVLGDVKTGVLVEDNSLAGIDNFIQQRANAIYILGYYLRLLFYPWPLVSDGSYNVFPALQLSDWKILLSIIVQAGMLAFAVVKFKSRSIFSLAILYFFITASIVSNVFFLIGTNYGERLMFMPSLGICMLIAAFLVNSFKSKNAVYADSLSGIYHSNKKLLSAAVFILLIFCTRTFSRNPAWKDNYTLYNTDIKQVPNSARMQFYLGEHLSLEETLKKYPSGADSLRMLSIEHLNKAIDIYPKYGGAYNLRGYLNYHLGKHDVAEEDYKKSVKYFPNNPVVYNNYGILYFDRKEYDKAFENFQKAILFYPRYSHALSNAGSLYGVLAVESYERGQADTLNQKQHIDSSMKYIQLSIDYFLRAIEADPLHGEPYRQLAAIYRMINEDGKAARYERMYRKIMEE